MNCHFMFFTVFGLFFDFSLFFVLFSFQINFFLTVSWLYTIFVWFYTSSLIVFGFGTLGQAGSGLPT